MASHTPEYLAGLVQELTRAPAETAWLEFKENQANPDEIGKNISALANSAALHERPQAHCLWGVADEDHSLVGTSFDPSTAKKGNEPLESWLSHTLEPKIRLAFHRVSIAGKRFVLLEVDPAERQPVAFNGSEYIRMGDTRKPLRKHPALEAELWRALDTTSYEEQVALENLDGDEVLRKLDYATFFSLLDLPLGTQRGTLEALAQHALIRSCPAGGWDITNLGAVLFATRLSDFPALERKAVRVIQYRGSSKIHGALRERPGQKGYAAGFHGLVGYIKSILPTNEAIRQALRETVPIFPELAIRELVANALIHQDLRITGAAPMVEIFEDRMEITNPGAPLVATERFVDSPPKSRNEQMAGLMHQFGICERRGSGIDKVLSEVELYQLPAPLFEAPPDSTRAVLYAHRPLKELSKKERIRACYLHACLRYEMGERMTNSSLRERFGIEESNAATASRLLSEAVEAKRIVVEDTEAGKRNRRYLPFWAGGTG